MRKTLTAALFLTLLSGCNGSNSVPPPATSTGIDTDFVVQGRYIMESEAPASTSAASLRVRPASLGAAKKFYIKGLVYWPTPIGKNVADAPMLNNALNDGNAAVWKRDLPLMRALGANAIHVYNVTPPGFDEKTGPITNFLTAAWNGGQNPIYVLMSIHFNGDALLNSGAVSSLAQQYHDLDMKYAKYPAVFGVTISNEIGANNFITNQQWWNGFNTVARAAKQGFADGGDANKIVTTSEPDGLIGFVKAGEKFGAAVDAWGINIYRGRTFTGLFEQLKATTNKPTMLTEYGAPASYHPAWKNVYKWQNGFYQTGQCQPGGSEPNGPPNDTNAKELPANGNPSMPGLVDLVRMNNLWMISGFNDENGLLAGGFYFEWTDEWWKGGNQNVHVGNPTFNPGFPGCSDDQAWYGLNSVTKGGALDKLTPRPTLTQLKKSFNQSP